MISTRAFAKALILDIVYPKSTIRRIISKRKHYFIFLCYSTWAYNEFNKEKQSSCSWGLNKYIVKLQHHKQHLFSFFFFVIIFSVFYLSNVSHWVLKLGWFVLYIYITLFLCHFSLVVENIWDVTHITNWTVNILTIPPIPIYYVIKWGYSV